MNEITLAKSWSVCALTAATLMASSGCCTTDSGHVEKYAFAQAQMGLEFRVILYAGDSHTAEAAARAAFERVAELNAVLSDYDSDSELSLLSQSSGSGEWRQVSPELWRVLREGQELASWSEGAFDLTVGPSVNLWRRARRQKELPTEDLLKRMRDRVGYQFLELDPSRRSARLLRPDMRLDAGGIAKGFALDEAMTVLRKRGIRQAMIQAGGDMVLGDPPPGLDGWRIELIGEGSGQPTVLKLRNCALATSGDLFQFVEIDGVRYSHIVDPRTGVGLTNRSLVHVIAPEGIIADSLGTALCVSPSKPERLVRHFRGVEFQVTTGTGADGEVVRSSGFDRYLQVEPRVFDN